MLWSLESGRARLYRAGRDEHDHTLEVAARRDAGRVVPRESDAWQVVWQGRTLCFTSATGTVVATAHKPSTIRERFELGGAALPVLGTVEVVPDRPWWRRWRLTTADGMPLGRVERGRWPGRTHALTLSGVGDPTELAAVLGWLVTLVTTDPPSGLRRLGERGRG